MGTNRRLKAARIVAGLTQKGIADRIGCREIEISRIETGRATPSMDLKIQIAGMLGKKTYEIFER